MLAAALVTWLVGLAVVGAGVGPLTASAWRSYQRSRSIRRRIRVYTMSDEGAAFLDSILVATLIAAVILLTAFLIVHT